MFLLGTRCWACAVLHAWQCRETIVANHVHHDSRLHGGRIESRQILQDEVCATCNLSACWLTGFPCFIFQVNSQHIWVTPAMSKVCYYFLQPSNLFFSCISVNALPRCGKEVFLCGVAWAGMWEQPLKREGKWSSMISKLNCFEILVVVPSNCFRLHHFWSLQHGYAMHDSRLESPALAKDILPMRTHDAQTRQCSFPFSINWILTGFLSEPQNISIKSKQ